MAIPTPADPGKRQQKARARKKPAIALDPPPIPAPAIDAAALAALAGAMVPPVPPVAGPPGLTARQKAYVRTLLEEDDRRRCEALKLYSPLPSQHAFHTSRARQRILRGSNRAGKTLGSMVELAWAATGQHPQAGKYPERDGRAIVVAKDLEKIGEVIWRQLGRAGSFKIVFDPVLDRWRTYNPITDIPRGLVPKPAPPLIPPRFIKDIAWESKKAGIPSKVILTNGWEINCYSSKSDPFSIQGTQIDIAVFDEEIVHKDWFPEANARLVDRVGFFWWGATPQTGTERLYDLHLRAEEAAEEGHADALVEEVFLSIWDNPYLDEKAKHDLVASLDEDERRVRIDAEFAISGTLIYESYFFPRGVHGVEAFPVPPGWTRFVAIDPGAQVCAVLFAAVPPMKPDSSGLPSSYFGDFVYFYDELYLRVCDADKFAKRLVAAVGDQQIHCYLIDHRGGRATEVGSGRTPEQQYRDALRREKLQHFVKGGSFVYGSDNLDGGILRVKECLRVRDDGTAKIRVVEGRCPMLVREMARYRWKTDAQHQVTDKPVKRNDHMPDVARYVVMHPGLKYHKPKDPKKAAGGAYEAFQAWQRREKARAKAERGSGVTLG